MNIFYFFFFLGYGHGHGHGTLHVVWWELCIFFLSFFSHMLNKQIKKKLHNERTITDNRHDIIVMLTANE